MTSKPVIERLKRVASHVPGVLKARDYFASRTFSPYIRTFQVAETSFRFFIGTRQAHQWYNPINKYALTEYQWVLENIPLKGQAILDAGAHHGHYSVIFCVGSQNSAEIIAVDPIASNCDLVLVNSMLNGGSVAIETCVVGATNNSIRFLPQSNGYIVTQGGLVLPAKTLPELMPHANVVKLDIEGAEFDVLPVQIDSLPKIHTWIVEIHPDDRRKPETLIDLFRKRDYVLNWVNRSTNVVESYPSNAQWSGHTTIFAQHRSSL